MLVPSSILKAASSSLHLSDSFLPAGDSQSLAHLSQAKYNAATHHARLLPATPIMPKPAFAEHELHGTQKTEALLGRV